MSSTGLSEDAVVACADLVGRAGAREFEMGWTCPHVPDELAPHTCPEVTWHAAAFYLGARIVTGRHRSPSTAALALAERLLRGTTCRCGKPVTLADAADGCRWRLVGQRWEPGCDAPPVHISGTRGDHAAMQRAFANRAERRAAQKRGTR
jgi:glutathione S-transferase